MVKETGDNHAGRVVAVQGPVVDVRFRDADSVPVIFSVFAGSM